MPKDIRYPIGRLDVTMAVELWANQDPKTLPFQWRVRQRVGWWLMRLGARCMSASVEITESASII
jgi:hypothetical protein